MCKQPCFFSYFFVIAFICVAALKPVWGSGPWSGAIKYHLSLTPQLKMNK